MDSVIFWNLVDLVDLSGDDTDALVTALESSGAARVREFGETVQRLARELLSSARNAPEDTLDFVGDGPELQALSVVLSGQIAYETALRRPLTLQAVEPFGTEDDILELCSELHARLTGVHLEFTAATASPMPSHWIKQTGGLVDEGLDHSSYAEVKRHLVGMAQVDAGLAAWWEASGNPVVEWSSWLTSEPTLRKGFDEKGAIAIRKYKSYVEVDLNSRAVEILPAADVDTLRALVLSEFSLVLAALRARYRLPPVPRIPVPW